MKERPIIFSAPMVQAILSGVKTQTRRIVKGPLEFLGGGGKDGPEWNDPSCWGWADEYGDFHTLAPDGQSSCDSSCSIPCPYGDPGDLLWVRETHWRNGYVSRWCISDPIEPKWITNQPIAGQELALRKLHVKFRDPGDPQHWKKCPAIHLPRWAARLELEIVSRRAERLKLISDEDARAEGVVDSFSGTYWPEYLSWKAVQANYRRLWEQLHGPDAWHANPFVWVLEFKVVFTDSDITAPVSEIGTDAAPQRGF